MLGQRRNRWPNIVSILGQCLAFAVNTVHAVDISISSISIKLVVLGLHKLSAKLRNEQPRYQDLHSTPGAPTP